MANAVSYKDKQISIGDTITVNYKIKEGDKERMQPFQGILIKITGTDKNMKSITVRKISNSGIGVEKIIPLNSPFVTDITLDKKSHFAKAKLYFVRNLSGQQMRYKLYRH